MKATVIGAGLAGCEVAYYLARHGVDVELWEMKPERFSPAHVSEGFAELVCSNSLKSDDPATASGMLKAEMRALGSVVLSCADVTSVPAGGALAVDREAFSAAVTERITACENVKVIRKEALEIPSEGEVIIATGPLTSDAMAKRIEALTGGEGLHFFDAASPIVTAESVDDKKSFRLARYGKGGDDYINCPLTKDEYEAFWRELVNAETAPLHEFEKECKVFESCMPVEIAAKRGPDTLRFGILKPVGLIDPATGRRPYAVLQLRQDNAEGTLYNLVGFQTNLKFGEQKRVFSMIPALANAEFVRYGVMHRNTYLDSPRLLNHDFSLKSDPRIYFAGQMTGVEGYIESAMSGLVAGIACFKRLKGEKLPPFPRETGIGALTAYVSSENADFQPMNINFGILPDTETHIRDKKEKRRRLSERSAEALKRYISENNV
ncbi:MAG: methylenetetrahydrofolate--tRNA-(uracil(54)-C(5))-methyltransferase (FADH(2)-oxidizing) TrmFO [Clostridia bacterium]|nr:methylenetetrahydrofolate--tRNA-(uracil(54)-C(5))-methyltransferase (FADH(2)-oxidizing) TrmFO [Clostridia bacterium]